MFTFCNSFKTDPTVSTSKKDTVTTEITPTDREVTDTILYLSDTTIRISNFSLSFQKVDSLEILSLYLDYQARQAILDRNDNSFAAAKALEQYLSQKQGEHFRRSGEELLLRLSNGKTISLKDIANEGEEERFTYENYFPQLDAYLIRVQWYEGNNHLLVDRRTGSKKYIIGQTYPSPLGTQLVAINEDLEAGYSGNGIQLLSKQGGNFITKFTIAAGRWAPIAVKWLDEENLILRVREAADDNLTAYKTTYYKMSIK